MKNQKRYMIAAAAMCIALIVAVAAFFVIRNQSMDENAVTRYEWLEMLESRYGIEEYGSVPYFKDVDSDDPHFASVQSAVEWEIIDAASRFNGNQYASGEFVALTAIKTIGESKLRIYLDSEDAITDDTYIELAVEKGIIEKEQLTKGLSLKECEQVLEDLNNLYFGEFWRDDYAKVTYQSGVVEMASADILQCNADCSEIMVTDNVGKSLETGMIIVFEQENTGLKIAREVTGISTDGTVSLKPAELDQVVESLVVSDIAEVTLEDIARYNGWERIDSVAGNSGYQQTDARLINTALHEGNIDSKGFKIAISVESDDDDEDEDTKSLEIEITENDTGIAYKLPIDVEVDSEEEFNVEIEIDKILVGAQVSCSGIMNVEYADVAVDANAVLKGEIKMEQEEKIPLFSIPVPLAGGIAAVDLQCCLVMSLEGSISFGVELPVEMSVHYEKDKGLRNLKREISFDSPVIEVSCSASTMLRIEPTLVIMGCLKVIDAEADVGLTAKAEIAMRHNKQVCADISVSYPIFTLSVGADDKADTFIQAIGLSGEWEIITADNAPYQKGFHFEKLPDDTVQFVEKCTYEEKKGIAHSSSNLAQSLFGGIIGEPWNERVAMDAVAALKSEGSIRALYREYGEGHVEIMSVIITGYIDRETGNLYRIESDVHIGDIQSVDRKDMYVVQRKDDIQVHCYWSKEMILCDEIEDVQELLAQRIMGCMCSVDELDFIGYQEIDGEQWWKVRAMSSEDSQILAIKPDGTEIKIEINEYIFDIYACPDNGIAPRAFKPTLEVSFEEFKNAESEVIDSDLLNWIF